MASNASLLETLIAVVIGAVIGFLSSIGLDWWKQGVEKKELRSRIREELEIILSEATSDYEKEAFQSRYYRTQAFTALIQDLIRKLDAKTFRAIEDAYGEVGRVNFPMSFVSNPLEEKKRQYEVTINAIKKTIELLK